MVPKDPTGIQDLRHVRSDRGRVAALALRRRRVEQRLLAFFRRSLEGALVFSTPGPAFAEGGLRTRADLVARLTEAQTAHVLRGFDESGLGLLPDDHRGPRRLRLRAAVGGAARERGRPACR